MQIGYTLIGTEPKPDLQEKYLAAGGSGELVGQFDVGAWGPDVAPYLDKLQAFADAGYSKVALVQVGPDQEQFCEWFTSTLKPAIAGLEQG